MVRGHQSSDGIYVSVAQTWTTHKGTISVTVNMPPPDVPCRCGGEYCQAQSEEDYE